MKPFDRHFTEIESYLCNFRKPDFNNLLKVLHRQEPDRPTLFEFFLNDGLYAKLTYKSKYDPDDSLAPMKRLIDAFKTAGYDYVTMHASDFCFETNRHQGANHATISLNEGNVIFDRESFESYNWLDPEAFDYSRLELLSDYLPEGMKIIAYGPGGVLENVIALVGYDTLCYMLADDPRLAGEIFDAVGSRLVSYYNICSKYASVGALISNDDWGFNTQTMLSVNDMRKFVFPWHKLIVETIHAHGKPAILHSCGNAALIMDDMVNDMKYDAKHSYEDNIHPVEGVYEEWGNRIAVLGGIDLDFVCRSTPEQVYNRSAAMLQRTKGRGGYALGSGNSIPYYVPHENYLAMVAAAVWN
jgi:uroporphyrinogen decarboxylase